MRFCSWGEGAVGGLGGGAGVDDGFGGYEIVGCYWDGRLGGCEEESELVGDEVAGEGGAGDCFF